MLYSLRNRKGFKTRWNKKKRTKTSYQFIAFFPFGNLHSKRDTEDLDTDNPKFYQGDHVKVIDGTFKGAEGYICRIKKNHRLIITVHGVCAVATSYIPQAFLKKIP